MYYLKRFFEFYLNSSIHVALAVYCLSWLTLLNFNIPYNGNILYFIFYATITGYNFVKYFGLAKFHHRSLTKELRIIQIFSFICFLLMCYYTLELQTKTIYAIGILGVITLLYAIPLLPKKVLFDERMNLRRISGFKVYVISFVWACVTVVLPIIDSGYNIDWDVVLTVIQIFIYVLVVMLPFEIRDMSYDNLRLSTIPQQIGVKKTKMIGVLLLIPFFFLEYFKDEISPTSIIALLIVMALTIIAIVLAKTKQSDYFSSFWVEGIPIVWLLVKMLGTGYL